VCLHLVANHVTDIIHFVADVYVVWLCCVFWLLFIYLFTYIVCKSAKLLIYL